MENEKLQNDNYRFSVIDEYLQIMGAEWLFDKNELRKRVPLASEDPDGTKFKLFFILLQFYVIAQAIVLETQEDIDDFCYFSKVLFKTQKIHGLNLDEIRPSYEKFCENKK